MSRDFIIYKENRTKVAADLDQGKLDYQDLSTWAFQDRFFAFLLAIRFFEICGASYPSPRRKEEVPVWFLLACLVQMKLHTTSSFNRLPGILRSGAVLSRVKFNIGGCEGGFNHKNKTERASAVHQDTARKFFKDTAPDKQREWHNKDVQKFIKVNKGFDKHGIFLLDQTHVVVPENENYKAAKKMPVDEHGQLIDTSGMSDEQKKAIRYRPCYALSELLHIEKAEHPSFIFAGYQWGPGNTDELVQGRKLVADFVDAVGRGVMKLLIADRGYISGKFVTYVKNDLGVDVLMPLRKNMDALTDPIRIAEFYKYKWKPYKKYTNRGVTYTEEVTVVEDVDIWDKCKVPLHISLMKISGSDGSLNYWGLSSTFKPGNPKEAFEAYDLRIQIEERHRQIKNYWHISEFSSPHCSLIEAHVMFTLLTYSFIQLYLSHKHLKTLANKTIDSWQQEERMGLNSVIVYSGQYFAVFDLSEYTEIIAFLKDDARARLQKWIKEFKRLDTG